MAKSKVQELHEAWTRLAPGEISLDRAAVAVATALKEDDAFREECNQTSRLMHHDKLVKIRDATARIAELEAEVARLKDLAEDNRRAADKAY